MRYRRNRLQLPKTAHKAPADFFRNDPFIDDSMKMIIVLWLHGGYTKKAAWTAIYKPKCKPNSIAPQVSCFFALKEVKEIVELFRNFYIENPYLNPKAWERR